MMAVILHDRVYVVLPDGAESGAIRAVSAGLRRLLRPASPPPAPPTSQASHRGADENGGGGGNVSVTINDGGGGDGADSPHRESSDGGGGGGGADVPAFELAALEVLLEVVCSDLAVLRAILAQFCAIPRNYLTARLRSTGAHRPPRRDGARGARRAAREVT